MSSDQSASSFNSSTAAAVAGDDMEDGIEISPSPCFVIKTKRESGIKVFINVCEHVEVPSVVSSLGLLKANRHWPAIASSPARLEIGHKDDKDEGEVWLYDVVVNPSVIQLTVVDVTVNTRDLVGG